MTYYPLDDVYGPIAFGRCVTACIGAGGDADACNSSCFKSWKFATYDLVTPLTYSGTGGTVGDAKTNTADHGGVYSTAAGGLTLASDLSLVYYTHLNVEGDLDAAGFALTLDDFAVLNITGSLLNAGAVTLGPFANLTVTDSAHGKGDWVMAGGGGCTSFGAYPFCSGMYAPGYWCDDQLVMSTMHIGGDLVVAADITIESPSGRPPTSYGCGDPEGVHMAIGGSLSIGGDLVATGGLGGYSYNPYATAVPAPLAHSPVFSHAPLDSLFGRTDYAVHIEVVKVMSVNGSARVAGGALMAVGGDATVISALTVDNAYLMEVGGALRSGSLTVSGFLMPTQLKVDGSAHISGNVVTSGYTSGEGFPGGYGGNDQAPSVVTFGNLNVGGSLSLLNMTHLVATGMAPGSLVISGDMLVGMQKTNTYQASTVVAAALVAVGGDLTLAGGVNTAVRVWSLNVSGLVDIVPHAILEIEGTSTSLAGDLRLQTDSRFYLSGLQARLHVHRSLALAPHFIHCCGGYCDYEDDDFDEDHTFASGPGDWTDGYQPTPTENASAACAWPPLLDPGYTAADFARGVDYWGSHNPASSCRYSAALCGADHTADTTPAWLVEDVPSGWAYDDMGDPACLVAGPKAAPPFASGYDNTVPCSGSGPSPPSGQTYLCEGDPAWCQKSPDPSKGTSFAECEATCKGV